MRRDTLPALAFPNQSVRHESAHLHVTGEATYLDDLVFAVYVLNKIVTDTDPNILREHWSGGEDVLDMIQRVLNAADSLVEKDILGRLKKMVKK